MFTWSPVRCGQREAAVSLCCLNDHLTVLRTICHSLLNDQTKSNYFLFLSLCFYSSSRGESPASAPSYIVSGETVKHVHTVQAQTSHRWLKSSSLWNKELIRVLWRPLVARLYIVATWDPYRSTVYGIQHTILYCTVWTSQSVVLRCINPWQQRLLQCSFT